MNSREPRSWPIQSTTVLACSYAASISPSAASPTAFRPCPRDRLRGQISTSTRPFLGSRRRRARHWRRPNARRSRWCCARRSRSSLAAPALARRRCSTPSCVFSSPRERDCCSPPQQAAPPSA